MKHLLKGNPLVLAAASAILLLGIIGVVGWPLHIQGANAPDEPPVEERETRTFRDRDDKLAEIGTSVPGFGGMYLDPTNQSVLNVFLLDTADAAAAEVQEAIAAKFPTPLRREASPSSRGNTPSTNSNPGTTTTSCQPWGSRRWYATA